MKQAQRQMVELEEFAAVCRERDAAREDAKTYQKQARDLDEICRGLRQEEQNLLKALVEHTDHARELGKERNGLQRELSIAKRANESLMEDIKQLKAQAVEAHGQFQKRVEELAAGLDASTALFKTAQDERDVARQEADYLRKRGQEAEERAVQLQEQIKVHEEVVERIREQNCRFVEEQREAKKRANATAASLVKAREDVSRLVMLCDDFKQELARITKEKNQVVEISNGFARERDEIQADYDARGRVIKKLRKRLHKLKKKLKH